MYVVPVTLQQITILVYTVLQESSTLNANTIPLENFVAAAVGEQPRAEQHAVHRLHSALGEVDRRDSALTRFDLHADETYREEFATTTVLLQSI